MTDDPRTREPIEPTYLGDGVYASFDGYQMWLHLNDHRSPALIALEPSVYKSLVEYAKRIWRQNEQPGNN